MLSHLILSYLNLSYLILSHLILSCFILSYLILYYVILSYLLLFHLILSCLILNYFIFSYLIFSSLSCLVCITKFPRDVSSKNLTHLPVRTCQFWCRFLLSFIKYYETCFQISMLTFSWTNGKVHSYFLNNSLPTIVDVLLKFFSREKNRKIRGPEDEGLRSSQLPAETSLRPFLRIS